MAKDVEYNVTASDKTGMALAAAERNFEKTKKKIDEGSKKAGEGLGKGLGDGITKATPGMLGNLGGVFSRAGVLAGPAIAGGLAYGAPLIGGVIAGAVIGGVGIGGVLGGVILASRDPAVQAAGKRLGFTLMSGLEQEARVFVEPTIAAVGKIEARFALMRPRIQSIFGGSVGFLDPLLDGVLNGVDGVLRGADRLISKGGPVIDAFGRLFTDVGNEVGDALDTIAGGSEDAAEAIDALSAITAASIQTFAGVTRALTETYGAFVTAGEAIQDFGEWLPNLQDLEGRTEDVGEAAEFTGEIVMRTAGALDAQAAAAQTAGSELATLTERINSVYNANRAVFDSQTNVAGAFDTLTKSVKDNGRTLDANTEKGRANRTALSNLASALNNSYQSYVSVNGEGRKANGVATSNYNSFIKAAQGLGISRKAAEDYARKLGIIPPKKNTDFTANTHDAAARAQALKEKIDSVKGKTVTVTVNVNASRLAKVQNQLDRLNGGKFAAGDHWAAMDLNTGATARTGGPTPVNVTSDVQVSLDGTPFYAMTARAVQASSQRDAWRQRVGRR